MNKETFMTGLTNEELDYIDYAFLNRKWGSVPQEILWKLEREFFNDVYGCHDSIVDTEDYFEEDVEEYLLEDLIDERYLEEVLSWGA